MKKRRIAIVTINSYNYGNRLQNYALQKVLEDLNSDVYTLPMHHFTWKREFKTLIKIMLYPYCKWRNWAWAYFDSKYIQWSKHAHSDIGIDGYFEYFIAGSDQIWNPFFAFNTDREFLVFASPKKRVAYAASLGISNLPNKETEDKFSGYWKQFAFISVRENSAADVIKACTGIDVSVVLDPTCLLSISQWTELSCKSRIIYSKKFIVKYFLSDVDDRFETEIADYAKRIQADIVDICSETRYNNEFIGPIEFLYLIQNSEFVFADSFHAAALSIVFNRDFFVFRRQEKQDTGDMNSRIETILGLFGLDRRYIETKEQFIENIDLHIDYVLTNKMLSEMKAKSLNYLKTVLRYDELNEC